MTHDFSGDNMLKFEFRSENKFFLKENPWEQISKVQFRIYKNRAMALDEDPENHQLSFQLN